MIDGSDSMSVSDAQQLAALHRTTLPLSVLGRMGEPTLQQYYRWAAKSTSEHVFLARERDLVTGVAVLSEEPATVIRRFVRATPWTFSRDALLTLVRSAEFRRDVRAFWRERSNETHEKPEVLQIFVDRERQSQKTGTRLLERVETWLRTHGVPRYYARTLAEQNEPTLTFYARRGFHEVGSRVFCGTRFVVLEKIVE